MPPRYSHRQSHLPPDELPGPSFSKTVPESPARCDRKPVFFTEPESPDNQRPPSEEHVLDVEILIHKLQLHQLELEEALLKQRYRKAARERLRLELIPASASASAPALTHLHRPFNPAATHRKQESLGTDTTFLRPLKPMDLGQNHVIKDGDIFGSLQQRSQGNGPRSRRPAPLNLLGVRNVVPQTVQSATLPQARTATSPGIGSSKQHWRRMTVSAGKNSTLIVMSSSGEAKELNFAVPPLPVMPDLLAAPPTSELSLEAPLVKAHQVRRDLGSFTPEQETNLFASRRISPDSRRHMNGAYVPDRSPQLSSPLLWGDDQSSTSSIKRLDNDTPAPSSPRSEGLRRKKSFFDRFDRKTKVDDVLDMYMTPEQLDEERALRAKPTRLRRQGMFRMWSSNEKESLHDTPD